MANDLVKGNGHTGGNGMLSVTQSLLRSLGTRRGSATETVLHREEAARMAIIDAANTARQATHVHMAEVDKRHEEWMEGVEAKIADARRSSTKAKAIELLFREKTEQLLAGVRDPSTMQAVNASVALIDDAIARLNK